MTYKNHTKEWGLTNDVLHSRGLMIEVLSFIYTFKHMTFCDQVCPSMMYLNTPLHRQYIRAYNKKQLGLCLGEKRFNIVDNCLTWIQMYIPEHNFIWLGYNNYTHKSVLKFVRKVLAFGLYCNTREHIWTLLNYILEATKN
jgi:hypothetical protein